MKITFLGTAAAEAFPSPFCSCETCERARKAGGRNIRTRSQAIIDDDLLIDFPADTFLHSMLYGVDLRKVRACIITHGHDDHLYPFDMIYRSEPYAHFPNGNEGKKPLDVYATKLSGEALRRCMASDMVSERDSSALAFHEIKKFQSYFIAGCEVIALTANHAIQYDSVIYIIKKDGKALLYAHDTGDFTADTVRFIQESGIVFDLVSLDCTSTMKDTSKFHMGLNQCIRMKAMLEEKNANENTVFVLNHFSHNGRATYDELVPLAKEKGFTVSYDNMTVEL